MRAILVATLLLPMLACADDRSCKYSEDRTLSLDFSGISHIVFDIGPHELRLTGSDRPDPQLRGQACASDSRFLPRLALLQERDDDRLIVRAQREKNVTGGIFRKKYARLYLTGAVPNDRAIEVIVGSGDAYLSDLSEVKVVVGSGDADIRRVGGPLTASVGSGDIEIRQAGSLYVGSIGSGDIDAADIRGEVTVGSIGSGDFELDHAGGDVTIGSVGSGDADLENVRGSVSLDTLGSGTLEARRIGGDLTVHSKGSGAVRHSDVQGQVNVPARR